MNLKSSPATTLLRELLLKRQAKNPGYSANAFARDLGISRAYLSLILSGQRPVTSRQAIRFVSALKLDRSTSRRFLKAAQLELLERSNAHSAGIGSLHESLAVERFRVIADWYHTAILDLSTLQGFKLDLSWISKRLGLTRLEARDAIERLVKLGLLKMSGSRLKKTNAHLYVATSQSEQAVRTHHSQMIAKALDELKNVDDAHFSRRSISGITVAVKPERLKEARKRLQEFQKDFAEFVSEGDDCTEVYQMNIQFFPLTKEES